MNLAFFVRGEFLSLIQIFQIFEIVKLLFWETKFQRWKGNLQSSMCVCVFECVSWNQSCVELCWADDENVEDQEDMEGHWGNATSGTIV